MSAEIHRLKNFNLRKVENPKSLRVAIIGAPNAGKSTLTNKLLGWKVAPVSCKVHTTRSRTTGVVTEGDSQIVILDTPGLIENSKLKRHNLETSLLIDPHVALLEADLSKLFLFIY